MVSAQKRRARSFPSRWMAKSSLSRCALFTDVFPCIVLKRIKLLPLSRVVEHIRTGVFKYNCAPGTSPLLAHV